MTLYAILAAAFGGLLLWWRARSARKERDAAIVDRDQQRGRADVAEATIAVTAEVHAGQAEGRVDEKRVETVAREAAAAGDAHPERAAAIERARIQADAAAKVRAAIVKVKPRKWGGW